MIARTLAVGAVALTLASPVAPAVAAPAVHRPLTEAVTAAVTDRLAAGKVPAAAYAVVEGDQVVTGGYGAGVTADTPFVLGSISKSFTALAVLQLVDRGAVRLDAPVTDTCPGSGPRARAACRRCVNCSIRRAGCPPRRASPTCRTPGVPWRNGSGHREVRPSSAPGERFQYCNLNFATLGLLVQEVSGRPFGDYLEAEVLRPLGMSHTYTVCRRGPRGGSGRGTVPWFGLAVRREAASFPGALPDGYLVSTAEDMSHYLRMQLGDGSCGKAGHLGGPAGAYATDRDKHTGGRGRTDTSTGYGLGLATGTAGVRPLVAHEGDVTGSTTTSVCCRSGTPAWSC